MDPEVQAAAAFGRVKAKGFEQRAGEHGVGAVRLSARGWGAQHLAAAGGGHVHGRVRHYVSCKLPYLASSAKKQRREDHG